MGSSMTSRRRSSSTPDWREHRLYDVRGGDGTEQPSLGTGAGLDPEHDRDELAGNGLGTLTVSGVL